MVEMTNNHKTILQYSYEDFLLTVHKLLPELQSRGYKNIYAIPRGGLIFATFLSHRLELPISNDMNEHTLVVDDICDTGATLKTIKADKVCLIAKELGIARTENLLFDIGLEDETWVEFFWEGKEK